MPVATLSGDRGIAEDAGGADGTDGADAADGAAVADGAAPGGQQQQQQQQQEQQERRRRKAALASPLADDPAAAAGECSFIADVFFLAQRHLHASLLPAVHRCAFAWGGGVRSRNAQRGWGAGAMSPPVAGRQTNES